MDVVSVLISRQSDWIAVLSLAFMLLSQFYKAVQRKFYDKTYTLLPTMKSKYSDDIDVDSDVMSSPKKSDDLVSPKSIPNFDHLNTYDLFKLWATVTMFIDHYGYFGLPGLTYTQMRYSRCIGRAAAPVFFFLCGWSSKKFRWPVFMVALYLYICTVILKVDLVYTPSESILCVAVINWIGEMLHNINVNKIHLIVHLIAFSTLAYSYNFFSKTLNIGYGSLPFMLAIAGTLLRSKHKYARAWIIGSMIVSCYWSVYVFSSNTIHTIVIVLVSCFNCLLMMIFKNISIPSLDKIGIFKESFKWLSRQGLIVYVGHLMLYRLIVQRKRHF